MLFKLYLYRPFNSLTPPLYIVLNFYYFNFTLLNLLIWFMLVFYTISYKSTYTSISDLFYRVFIDDFFFNNFYYFWTVFRYIPLIVLTLLLLYLVYITPESLNLILVICVTWVMYLLYVVDFWLLLPSHYLNCIDSTGVNTLLLNNINKYHPFIFYLSLMLLYAVFLNSFRVIFFSEEVLFKLNVIKLSFFSFSYTHLYLITNALFLGSWWAVQEGSWGGWWNWDPSEVFGLVILIVSLVFIHSKLAISNHLYTLRLYKLLSSCLLSIYLFIQLNFNLISHNFNLIGDSNLYFFVVFLILFTLSLNKVACSAYSYIYTVLSFVGLYNNTLKLKYSSDNRIYYFSSLFNVLVLVVVLISFRDLVNEFTFLVLGSELFNIYFNLTTLLVYIISLAIINSWYLSIWGFTTYVLIYYYVGLWPLLLLSISLYSISYLNVIHVNIYLHLIINVLVVGWVVTSWKGYNPSVNSDLYLLAEFYLYDVLSTFSNTLEYSYITIKNSLYVDTSTTFFMGKSTPETNLFNLSSSLGFVFQRLFIGGTFFILMVEVVDPTLLTLLTACFVIYFLTSVLVKKSKLIIF